MSTEAYMNESTTRAGFGFVPWLMMTLFTVAGASFSLWAALQQTDTVNSVSFSAWPE